MSHHGVHKAKMQEQVYRPHIKVEHLSERTGAFEKATIRHVYAFQWSKEKPSNNALSFSYMMVVVFPAVGDWFAIETNGSESQSKNFAGDKMYESTLDTLGSQKV
jgi:hypothetical protein